jgi:hypothetical protein
MSDDYQPVRDAIAALPASERDQLAATVARLLAEASDGTNGAAT